MRLNVYDLKNAFLAFCNRLSQVSITQHGTSHEGYDVTAHKSLRGTPNLDELQEKSGVTGIESQFLAAGIDFFTIHEICAFLNTAWERLHEEKTREIASRLIGDAGVVTSVDSLIKEHGTLNRMTPLIKEVDAKTGLRFGTARYNERSAENARIFVIPKEIREFGEPTIMSVQIEGFDANRLSHNWPKFSRMCRFVGSSEITTLINLASNSRYAAGALCRQRRWHGEIETIDSDNYNDYRGTTRPGYSVIEVFHFNDEFNRANTSGALANLWKAKELFCVFSYIAYPPPLLPEHFDEKHVSAYTEEEELRMIQERDAKIVPYRVLEVEYGYQIAYEAAKLAVGFSGGGGS
ncbi:hypothetical protein [Azobacteroides phage ProJPt-Bp1]|uniref:Uncharacterized protein n=1 Tax=Azobacteroides phage ProJPt-Bp1 TaxID=1920526 RepID=A0A1V1FS94_9CAUD|nr:hypothetical protein KNT10_gp28 [Azobacteroides phage ProJPt-Bp1]BAX03435.1 hypothetical protein [Azobacteroides phage ProJPt-Bp1]